MRHAIEVNHEDGTAVLTAPGLDAPITFQSTTGHAAFEAAADFAAERLDLRSIRWEPVSSCDAGVWLWRWEKENEMDWITNSPSTAPYQASIPTILGEPMPTEKFTRSELIALNMVGVYAYYPQCKNCTFDLHLHYPVEEIDGPGFYCPMCGWERNPMESEDDVKTPSSLAALRWSRATPAQKSAHAAAMASARWSDKPPVPCKRCGREWRSIREAARCPCPPAPRGRRKEPVASP